MGAQELMELGWDGRLDLIALNNPLFEQIILKVAKFTHRKTVAFGKRDHIVVMIDDGDIQSALVSCKIWH